MPKKGKNKGKVGGRHRPNPFSGDVALDDFANNDKQRPGPSRMCRMIPHCFAQEAELDDKDSEDLDWFDKDFDDNCVISEDTKGEDQEVAKGCRNRTKRASDTTALVTKDNGEKVYPPDLWFILSDYILPADIGRFAGICRSAYEVTHTTQFWIRLYKSYSTPMSSVPLRLQPHYVIGKIEGLRASVVRALYSLYEPFVERHRLNQEKEAHCLLQKYCVYAWHQKGKTMFNYFFQMDDRSEPDDETCIDIYKKSEETHYRGMLGNIFANSDKRTKILQVISKSFISIPPSVMCNSLLSVSSTLSLDFRSHDLRLIFGPSHALHYYPKKKIQFSNIPEGCTGVLIRSVVTTKVLDWWSPNYPCKTVEPLERSERPQQQQDHDDDGYF